VSNVWFASNRIEAALKALGYAAPYLGMPSDQAMSLVADALEDIIVKESARQGIMERMKLEREVRGESSEGIRLMNELLGPFGSPRKEIP
jgi:hypothetical protein